MVINIEIFYVRIFSDFSATAGRARSENRKSARTLERQQQVELNQTFIENEKKNASFLCDDWSLFWCRLNFMTVLRRASSVTLRWNHKFNQFYREKCFSLAFADVFQFCWSSLSSWCYREQNSFLVELNKSSIDAIRHIDLANIISFEQARVGGEGKSWCQSSFRQLIIGTQLIW